MTDVLVVAAETELRHLLPRLLRAAGYRVTLAYDVIEAFELVQSYTPDAIVLDLVLPHVSGWSFIQQAQQLPPIRHVPIVALSHRPDEEQGAVLGLGCAACLSKPLQIGRFLDTIQQIVARQRTTCCS